MNKHLNAQQSLKMLECIQKYIVLYNGWLYHRRANNDLKILAAHFEIWNCTGTVTLRVWNTLTL